MPSHGDPRNTSVPVSSHTKWKILKLHVHVPSHHNHRLSFWEWRRNIREEWQERQQAHDVSTCKPLRPHFNPALISPSKSVPFGNILQKKKKKRLEGPHRVTAQPAKKNIFTTMATTIPLPGPVLKKTPGMHEFSLAYSENHVLTLTYIWVVFFLLPFLLFFLCFHLPFVHLRVACMYARVPRTCDQMTTVEIG